MTLGQLALLLRVDAPPAEPEQVGTLDDLIQMQRMKEAARGR